MSFLRGKETGKRSQKRSKNLGFSGEFEGFGAGNEALHYYTINTHSWQDSLWFFGRLGQQGGEKP